MHTPDGRSKGCGIVEFASADGAKQAVLTLNDTELLGRQIFVREDREEQRGGGGGASQSQNSAHHKQSQRTGSNHQFSQGEQAQGRRVYVGNLSWDVGECLIMLPIWPRVFLTQLVPF
jgi:RNA recognition motif-containing protein